MCSCKEHNWCRTWEETKDGKYPPSEHAPGCEEYKPQKYIRLGYDGTYCVMTLDDAMDYLDEIKYNEDADEYTYEEIYLTKDQFEKLPEFQGF